MADKAAEKKTAAKKPAAEKKTTAKKAATPKAAAEKAAAAPKAAAEKKTAAKKPAAKKAEPVIKTILQFEGKDFDISNVAEKALKEYKSVHKRKTVNEFVVYVKPEENAAYYTVNGEVQEDFKVDL